MAKKFVWYAGYGSNLHRDRFLCYIQGGLAPGAQIVNPGCTDKSLPLQDCPIELPYQLYFAGHSLTWDCGVCFITHDSRRYSTKTKARAYLISEEQFWEIVAQESKQSGQKPCDLGLLRTRGSLLVGQGRYDRLVYGGELDGYPILSFTAPIQHRTSSTPSPAYLSLIMQGLKEAHGMTAESIAIYLATTQGVAGNYTKSQLLGLYRELSSSTIV